MLLCKEFAARSVGHASHEPEHERRVITTKADITVVQLLVTSTAISYIRAIASGSGKDCKK